MYNLTGLILVPPRFQKQSEPDTSPDLLLLIPESNAVLLLLLLLMMMMMMMMMMSFSPLHLQAVNAMIHSIAFRGEQQQPR